MNSVIIVKASDKFKEISPVADLSEADASELIKGVFANESERSEDSRNIDPHLNKTGTKVSL